MKSAHAKKQTRNDKLGRFESRGVMINHLLRTLLGKLKLIQVSQCPPALNPPFLSPAQAGEVELREVSSEQWEVWTQSETIFLSIPSSRLANFSTH